MVLPLRLQLGLLLLASIALESGCASYRLGLSSAPTIDEYDAKNGTISLKGVDLSMWLNNSVSTFHLFSVTYVPVYISTKDRELYREEKLRVNLGYLPKEPGFSLNPSQITLRYEGKSYHASVASSWLALPEKHRSAYYYDHCGKAVPESYQRITRSPVPESKWHCYAVTFDVKPPHPSEFFSIAINGMKKNDQKYEVPEIGFQQYKWELVE